MEKIQSSKNPKIKYLLSLKEKRNREKEQAFLVEGKREIEKAIRAGFSLKSLFISDPVDLIEGFEEKSFLLDEKVLEKISYRSGSEMSLAIFSYKKRDPIVIHERGFYLVIEEIEKPGNLGAILRSLDGAGVEGLFICSKSIDLYNPNLIRSSLGACFSFPIELKELESLKGELDKKNIPLVATSPYASSPYWQIDPKIRGLAWLMGSEKDGISEKAKKLSEKVVKIPMMGEIDSLNIAASVAVLVYDSRRRWSE